LSRLFLSHSSANNREAVALKQWLAKQNPRLANEIFLDLDRGTGIYIGQRWREALNRAATRCEGVVCLLSTQWEASEWCRWEYSYAAELGKRIFVALLQPGTGAELLEWQQCKLFGDGPNTAIDIGDGEPVLFATDGLYRLREGIRRSGIGSDSFEWPIDDPERAPYRGWRPFEPVDAGIFCGRDAQIVAAMDALRSVRQAKTKQWFVILGPSGSGKSSFLRAGLIPRMQRDDRQFLVLDIVRPERDVLLGANSLATVIHSARQAKNLAEPPLEDIEAACANDATEVRRLLTELQEAARLQFLGAGENETPPTIVLPLDQAEELLSPDGAGPADRFLALMQELANPVGDSRLDMIVVATIRSDRFGGLQARPELAGAELFGELRPMATERFEEVITGPAERATADGRPLEFAPDLVDRLLADCKEGGDALPLLALTLSRLYEKYGAAKKLTLSHYEEIGGLRRVVQTVIDGILDEDPSVRVGQLQLLRAAFIPWLATVNPDTDQPMRRVARWSDLPESSRPLMDGFVSNRLLVKDRRDNDEVVEVALESLLWQWDDLATWLHDTWRELKAVDDLERAAAAWELNNRHHDWVLSGSRLFDAETLASAPGFADRLASTRDYLAACRQAEDERLAAEEAQRQAELRHAQELARNAEERQQTAEAHAVVLRRRSQVLRRVLTGTAIVAIIAVVGAVVAVIGFRQATAAKHQAQERYRQAVALRLGTDAGATQAGTNPGGDVKAFLQAVAAERIAPGTGAAPMFDAVVNRFSTVKIVTGHAESVAFSPDGHRLAAGGADNTIRLLDADTFQQIGPTMAAPTYYAKPGPYGGSAGGVGSVAFSPDGHRLASGSADNTVRLWNTDTGQQIGTPLTGSSGAVSGVAFSPDGHRVASAGGGVLRLWNADTGQQIGPPLTAPQGSYGATPGGVISVAFSPDGHRLAAGGDINDKTIRFWDANTGQQIGPPLIGHSGAVFGVAFSPDGHRLASAGPSGGDGTIRLWNVDTGQQIGDPLIGPSGPEGVVFSPDGHRLAAGGQTIRLWDADTGQPLATSLAGQPVGATKVVFSPDGHRLAAVGYDGAVRVWNVDPPQSLGVPLKGHKDVVSAAAFSPDGHRLASSSWDKTVQLWNVDTRQPLGAPLSTDGASSVAFSPDGQRLASGGNDKTIQLWNADTGQQIGTPLTGHTGTVLDVVFSPDGHRLASASYDNTVRLWNADTGQQIGAPLAGHHGAVNSVAFSPNGHWLASGGDDKTVRLWNADTGQQIGAPLDGHTKEVAGVAVSPDGQRLASASWDGTVRLWNADTGQQIGAPLTGHTVGATSVAFSPDGHQLVSGGKGGELRMWDADTGRPLGEPLIGHTSWVTSVAFSADGKAFASASWDATVRIWPGPTAWPEILCDKLTVNMSHQQWRDWIAPDVSYMQLCPNLPVPPDSPS
jgi:WD40 repeat protein